MTIIYIAVAFILGIAISTIFIKSRTDSADKTHVSKLATENKSLQEKLNTTLNDAENKIVEIENDSEKRIKEISMRYDVLLKEASAQSEMLDKQYKDALDGKIDDSLNDKLSQFDELKKKIKDLEDEIEDNEDDLSNLKKKLKIKDDNLSELNDSLSKEKKEAKALSEELSSVKLSLEEKMEELNIKKESIDFVQEILSSPEMYHNDIKATYENVSQLKSFATDQLFNCYSTLNDRYINFGDNFEQYKEHWKQRFEGWSSVTKKTWINGKKTIAFIGEFSAGKTSIVNRILSQDDPSVPQLPVSTKATTAIATYIAGGPAVSYQFVTPDDKLKSISQKTFTEKVSKEVLDQIKGVTSLIHYFVMTYKNPNLDGLSILDTPGFNSNDKQDAQNTMEVINECDALFWVVDVNSGDVNRSSISIIKEFLNKPLYVVINKVDTKSESEVQKVEIKIKKTFEDEGVNIEEFIRFSSKSPLSDIMDPIKSVEHSNDRESYISDLREDIDGILNLLDNQVKETNNEYHNAISEGNIITDKFCDLMKSLYSQCETASGIPRYQSNFFSKDNYEMSQSEYNRLCTILNKSCNHVEQMGVIYDEQADSSAKIQEAWGRFCEVKEAWQGVNNIKSQFEKIVNKL